jgi:hypothetical protein
MKKNILIFALLSFVHFSNAQMQDKFWVLFGTEIVHGRFAGISPQVSDDRYKLYNMATSKMEMMGARGNAFVDFSINSIWVFNMKNENRSSSLTEEGFHKVRNMPLFRFCHFKLRGDESSSKTRFGMGWQFDWRRVGLANNSDNNLQSAFGSPGLSYGPLELKGRFGVGGNLHLVRQTKLLYSRLSLNLDYSPGKIQGVALYPEGTFLVHYKRVGIYGTASYRTDYLWGNRQTAEKGFNNLPKKTNTTTRDFRQQLVVAFEIWMFGKK